MLSGIRTTLPTRVCKANNNNSLKFNKAIQLDPSKMERLVKFTSNMHNNLPAHIIKKEDLDLCYNAEFAWGSVNKDEFVRYAENCNSSQWKGVSVKRIPFSIDSRILTTNNVYFNEINQVKSLVNLALLGISFLNPAVLFEGKSSFDLAMIYYPEHSLQPSFTTVPHNDTYKSTCLFDLSNTCSETKIYFDFEGKYLVNFLQRKSGQGLVFPQKEKYSINQLGINLDTVSEVYMRQNCSISCISKDTDPTIFKSIVDELNDNRDIKCTILHQAIGDTPRLVASLCEDISK